MTTKIKPSYGTYVRDNWTYTLAKYNQNDNMVVFSIAHNWLDSKVSCSLIDDIESVFESAKIFVRATVYNEGKILLNISGYHIPELIAWVNPFGEISYTSSQDGLKFWHHWLYELSKKRNNYREDFELVERGTWRKIQLKRD